MSFENQIRVKSRSHRPTSPDLLYLSKSAWKKSAISQQEWALRLSKQFSVSAQTIFVTLTFDDEHLQYFHYSPYVKWDCKCFDNLGFREDLIRTLRQVDGYSFKYVAFPEYGSDEEYYDYKGRLRKATMRPHYHVMFFFDYPVDVSIFRNSVLQRWGRCRDCALDVVEIKYDEGFSRYVSKYVSKGFYDLLPNDLVDRVLHYKNELKKIDSNSSLENSRRSFDFHYMCDFLNWFENHRPKVLSSKGVGNFSYSDDEFMRGSTLLFNGKKYEDVPLSSYNKRNKYYDRSKSFIYHKFKRRGSSLEIFDDFHPFVNYDWSLNDFGRKALYKQMLLHYDLCRNWFVSALNLKGVIPLDGIQYYNDNFPESVPLDYGTTYEEYVGDLSSYDIDLLVSYKLFYLKYDVDRLSDVLDIDICKLSTSELKYNWLNFYSMLLNSPSDISLYKPSKKDFVSIADVNMDYYNARILFNNLFAIVEMSEYVSYLERKRQRDEKKSYNHVVFDSKKRY